MCDREVTTMCVGEPAERSTIRLHVILTPTRVDEVAIHLPRQIPNVCETDQGIGATGFSERDWFQQADAPRNRRYIACKAFFLHDMSCDVPGTAVCEEVNQIRFDTSTHLSTRTAAQVGSPHAWSNDVWDSTTVATCGNPRTQIPYNGKTGTAETPT